MILVFGTWIFRGLSGLDVRKVIYKEILYNMKIYWIVVGVGNGEKIISGDRVFFIILEFFFICDYGDLVLSFEWGGYMDVSWSSDIRRAGDL